MNKEFHDKNVQYLQFQRNIFAFFASILAVSIVLFAILLFFKRERIIISPPTIEHEFWLAANQVSPTYLEQYGTFLGQLLLSKSPESAPTQRAILLRHADASFSQTLKNKLLEEEERLQKQDAAYTFFPVKIQVNNRSNEVLIEGDRIFYVSDQQVSSERESYILSFRYTGSKLLLKGIKAHEKGGFSSCVK